MDQHLTAMLLAGALGSVSALVAFALIALRLRVDGRTLRSFRP